jgi:hypothetical protein
MSKQIHDLLLRGLAIPANPLALTSARKLDERRQRALTRYYIDAGSGGLAVGVHTTQFAIRDPKIGLFKPVLQLAAEEMNRADATRKEPLVRIAGVCGKTTQATAEAGLIRELGYHAGLLSLAAMKDATLGYYGYLHIAEPEDALLLSEFTMLKTIPGEDYKVSLKPASQVAQCVDGVLVLFDLQQKGLSGVLIDQRKQAVRCTGEQAAAASQ